MPDPWRFETYRLASGLNMRIARAGEPGRPLVVMLHGFPECWYSWRHQLRALSDSFECVAPEMRGYGETDAPAGVARRPGLVPVADAARAGGPPRLVAVNVDPREGEPARLTIEEFQSAVTHMKNVGSSEARVEARQQEDRQPKPKANLRPEANPRWGMMRSGTKPKRSPCQGTECRPLHEPYLACPEWRSGKPQDHSQVQ